MEKKNSFDLQKIKDEISSPVLSVRLKTLEQLLSEFHDNDQIMELLKERYKLESDYECKKLIMHAIEIFGQSIIKKAEKRAVRLDNFKKEEFVLLSDYERLLFFREISGKDAGKIAHLAPELLAAEKNPFVAAALIKTFSRLWPHENLKDLASNLLSSSSSVQMAILDLLINISPQSLTRYLPKLLTSGDPRLHLFAIRGMAKIDLPEALLHLEEFLFSQEKSGREVAILDLFHFPFIEIKPVLLKYFAFESDLKLLEMAGSLFEINPDPEVPFKLWEIAEDSFLEKAQTLKTIVQSACKVIKDSGILADNYDSYMLKLKEWVQRHKAQRFVQDTIIKLKATSSSEWDDFTSRIHAAMKIKFCFEAFKMAINWTIDPAIKEYLQKLIQEVEVQSIKIQDDRKPAQDYFTLSKSERVRYFTENTDESEEIRQSKLKIALEVINNDKFDFGEKALALRRCGKAKYSGLGAIANKWLNCSNDELQTAAMDYLVETDNERLYPQLEKLIKNSSIKVQIEAIKILQKSDPKYSLSHVKLLLGKKNQTSQEVGLAALGNYNFPLVRDILFDFLTDQISDSFFDSGLFLFQTNPDRENLYYLYRLEKKTSNKRTNQVNNVRKQMISNLISLDIIKQNAIAKLESEWQLRFEKEHASLNDSPKPYSLKVLKTSELNVTSRNNLFSFFRILSGTDPQKMWIIIGVLLLVLSLFIFGRLN
ncbi:MAG: hypothetical protein HQM10_25155 [Candidatus Riflebacteria bacterium]|nr:hypothetical protein [Candidatus Riflebacteria bacterium]